MVDTVPSQAPSPGSPKRSDSGRAISKALLPTPGAIEPAVTGLPASRQGTGPVSVLSGTSTGKKATLPTKPATNLESGFS